MDLASILQKIVVASPLILLLLGLWWRTRRIGSAHRKIAALEKEVAELKAFKAEIDALRTKNPYEMMVIRNGLRGTA